MIIKRKQYWYLDVAINGVRYREALHTTDRREALALEKKRVADIQAGKGASKTGRQFARLPFGEAADQFREQRSLVVSERTGQLDRERLKPLRAFFGDKPLLRITAADIVAYQRARIDGSIRLKNRAKGVANRTVNMELTVLRQLLRRAKVWSALSEDVAMLPEGHEIKGKVLTKEGKELLFRVAGSKDLWMVAHCAAVLAVSTTCRGVELKNLRWKDVDLFDRKISIRRSKRETGHRTIPLNAEATNALGRLLSRAESNGSMASDNYVFPACENGIFDATRPQKTWRTAWRSLVKEAAKQAGLEASQRAIESGGDAALAYSKATGQFKGLRFHDLRHQAITELAENGAPDATIMALAGHLSRAMLEHYSHVRMAAKRTAVDGLGTGIGAFQDAQVGTKPPSVQ